MFVTIINNIRIIIKYRYRLILNVILNLEFSILKDLINNNLLSFRLLYIISKSRYRFLLFSKNLIFFEREFIISNYSINTIFSNNCNKYNLKIYINL